MYKFAIHIITGLSGSGKSTAIAAFEDAGFYCVDNMPIDLLPKFLELPVEKPSEITGFAFVMDIREKEFPAKYHDIFETLKENSYKLKILFLEASEDILLQRYSQTRRHHPLSHHKNLINGIRSEKKQLGNLRKTADKIIETSNYNTHELKSAIFKIARESIKIAPMRINILSFGFKYGILHDVDLIVDVRFLSNPFFVPELKHLSGENKKVSNYVLDNDQAGIFLKKYLDLLDYLIPLYEKEGKSYLTIALGCTGGRHRSVAIARRVYEKIAKQNKRIEITHRDIDQ